MQTTDTDPLAILVTTTAAPPPPGGRSEVGRDAAISGLNEANRRLKEANSQIHERHKAELAKRDATITQIRENGRQLLDEARQEIVELARKLTAAELEVASLNVRHAAQIKQNEYLHGVIADHEKEIDQQIAIAEKLRNELRAQLERAEAEVERLVEGCVHAQWRTGTTGVDGGHGFSWRFGNSSGWVYEKSNAIAGVRKAAGLAPTPAAEAPEQGEGAWRVEKSTLYTCGLDGTNWIYAEFREAKSGTGAHQVELEAVARRCAAALNGEADEAKLRAVLRKSCDDHVTLAGQYERGGNTRGSMQLRAVANLLGIILQGREPLTVCPPVAPATEGETKS